MPKPKLSNDLKQFFISLWLSTVHSAIRNVTWLAIFVTGGISLLLLIISENASDHANFLGFSKASWLSVNGSVFASFLFLIIHSTILALQQGTNHVHKTIYDTLVETFGLKAIHEQRGSSDIVETYSLKIRESRQRIWAFGMSNRHFVQQHLETILELVKFRPISIVIAFWDPHSSILVGNTGQTYSTIQFQQMLEQGNASIPPADSALQYPDFKPVVNGQIEHIKKRVENIQLHAEAHLQLALISSVSHFSALLIDSEIFFFPFLVGSVDSTNQPIIQCSAKTGIGSIVTEHFTQLQRKPHACRFVYDSKSKTS